jgi:hypothetical protein
MRAAFASHSVFVVLPAVLTAGRHYHPKTEEGILLNLR